MVEKLIIEAEGDGETLEVLIIISKAPLINAYYDNCSVRICQSVLILLNHGQARLNYLEYKYIQRSNYRKGCGVSQVSHVKM